MEVGNAVFVDELTKLQLEPVTNPVYDGPIELHVLRKDTASGEEDYLIRYPAGRRCKLHRHTAAHTVVVLEGSLNANGVVVGPGAYVHFPGGGPMRHEPAGGGPCLFVILFRGPFDFEVLEGQAGG